MCTIIKEYKYPNTRTILEWLSRLTNQVMRSILVNPAFRKFLSIQQAIHPTIPDEGLSASNVLATYPQGKFFYIFRES